jgi:hypothetical protein
MWWMCFVQGADGHGQQIHGLQTVSPPTRVSMSLSFPLQLFETTIHRFILFAIAWNHVLCLSVCRIPSDLREDMRKFFNFMSESDTRRNELLSERIILNQLSPELRFAVSL